MSNPRPGPRVNAGRPLGSVAAKRQITAEMIGHGEYLPVEYMLALMRDEQAEPQRRDAMAIQAAPYCHARLSAVATTNPNGTGPQSGDINLVQIFAVPRGAALDLKDGVVTIEGNEAQLKPVEPFEGTPPLRGAPDARESVALPVKIGSPRSEPLPVHNIDIVNVTRLDTYRRDE